jgi:Neocarzinostatin family
VSWLWIVSGGLSGYRPNGKRLDMMSSRMMVPRVVGGTFWALALLALVPGASSGAAGLSTRGADREARPAAFYARDGARAGHKVIRRNAWIAEKERKKTKPDSPHTLVSLHVTPHAGLTAGKGVTVSASGLPHDATGWILECSSVNGQPTVKFSGVHLPVSCSSPKIVHFDAEGKLSAVKVTIRSGAAGPAVRGTDSLGKSAVIAAKDYPCPPTASQVSAGAFCYVELRWGAGVGREVTQPVTFTRVIKRTTAKAKKTTVRTTAVTKVGKTGKSGTTAPSSGTDPASAQLPFTGVSVVQMALVGGALVALGAALLLVGEPSRRRDRRRPLSPWVANS